LREFITAPMVSVIFLLAAISLILQNKRSEILYSLLPGAQFIQFPWRLMTITTIALLLLGFGCLSSLQSTTKHSVFLGVGILATIVLIASSGVWQRLNYYEIPDRLDSKSSRHLDHYSLSLFGEYLPDHARLLEPDPAVSTVFSSWHGSLNEFIRFENTRRGCIVQTLAAVTESRKTNFRVICDSESLVLLPIFATTAHSVSGGITLNCAFSDELQHLCAVRAKAGSTLIAIHQPTWLSIVRAIFGGNNSGVP